MGVAFGMMLGTVWHFKGANPQIRVFGISSQLYYVCMLVRLLLSSCLSLERDTVSLRDATARPCTLLLLTVGYHHSSSPLSPTMLLFSSGIGRRLSRTLPSSFAALTSSFHPVVVGNNKVGESISRRVGGHWIVVSTTTSNNDNNNSSTDDDVIGRVNIRAFSSSSTPLSFAAPSLPSSSSINAESRATAADAASKRHLYADGPPESLTIETILAIQEVMKFYILHGIGKYKLGQIAAANTTTTTTDDTSSSLVERWQRMIAIYLETQCRAISLMGYSPDEYGITRYTQQVQRVMSVSSPSEQEEVRLAGRDTYRLVLSSAFATTVPNLLNEQNTKKGGGELSIVDARNIMHKVSLRMLETEILEKVSKRCAAAAAAARGAAGASAHGGDGNASSSTDEENDLQLEFARKHTIVQEVMVTDVYLSSSDGGGDATTTTTSRPSLVEECGFGTGEAGYVRLQYALAEHQGDPLITQYVGTAIMQLLQAAGIDMEAMQKQAQEMQQKAAAAAAVK